MKRLLHLTMLSLTTLGLALVGTAVLADDDSDEGNQRRERRIELRRLVGKHWIGVMTMPVDAALKSHLNISDRVMVANVVPDGPAEKAGLRRFDVLLTFDDDKIETVNDLFKAVGGTEGKEAEMKLLRGGKEMTIEITPDERPEAIQFFPEAQGLLRPLDRWLRETADAPFRLRFLGPGVITAQPAELPGNLSITIKKEGDEPAKIVVKRDEETWEITDDNVDELPDELQPHVSRFLKGRAVVIQPGVRTVWNLGENGEVRVPPHNLIPHGIPPGASKQVEEALRRIEEFQRRFAEEDPLKALRKEVESLRREVEKLRDKDSGTDSEADGALEA